MRFSVSFRYAVAALAVLLASALGPRPADAGDRLERLERQLAGHIVDHTQNHGPDRRIFSRQLCEPRDLYVYLPPGVSRCSRCEEGPRVPVVFWFHGAFGDEEGFLDSHAILWLDRAVSRGGVPPVIVVAPDCSIDGEGRVTSRHSFLVDGPRGRFEQYFLHDVVPFVDTQYPVRRDRGGRGLMGVSAGGFCAVSLAIQHRDQFSAVAGVAAAVNLRYATTEGYRHDFDPRTFRFETLYRPREVVGRFFGLVGLRRAPLVEAAFGPPERILQNVRKENPADLLLTSNLKPGELDIYLHYAGRDNFNIDAQNESFVYLARRQGIPVTVEVDPSGRHLDPYFRIGEPKAIAWLISRLTSPEPTLPRGTPGAPTELPPLVVLPTP